MRQFHIFSRDFLKLKEAMTLIVMNNLKRIEITELNRPHTK